jgi:hypothetical protein
VRANVAVQETGEANEIVRGNGEPQKLQPAIFGAALAINVP